VPGRGGIPEIDRELRVLDPPRRTGVLPLHAWRQGSFLDISGLVHHQHCTRIAQVLDEVTTQVIADAIGVPLRPR